MLPLHHARSWNNHIICMNDCQYSKIYLYFLSIFFTVSWIKSSSGAVIKKGKHIINAKRQNISTVFIKFVDLFILSFVWNNNIYVRLFQYPWSDSNRHWTDFKSASSADWDTRAKTQHKLGIGILGVEPRLTRYKQAALTIKLYPLRYKTIIRHKP